MAASPQNDDHRDHHHSGRSHRSKHRRTSSRRKGHSRSYLRQNAIVLGALAAVALLLLASIVFVEYQRRKSENQFQKTEHSDKDVSIPLASRTKAVPIPTQTARRATPRPTPVFKPVYTPIPFRQHGEVSAAAIIIDDIGLKREFEREFVNLDAEIAFSVLPNMPFTREMAHYIHQKGLIVMAHLPMEPHKTETMNSMLPWLRVGMRKFELQGILDQILTENPYAVGANNHTGSRLSISGPELAVILDYLREKGFFYVDSRTTPDTIAYQMALQRGIPTTQRNVFFDDEDTRDAVIIQCERFIELAQRNGRVVGIGHPHESTLQVLREYLPKFRQANITLVPITSLLEPAF